jgi:hypothetical protein
MATRNDAVRYRLFFPQGDQLTTNAKSPSVSTLQTREHPLSYRFKWSNGYIDGDEIHPRYLSWYPERGKDYVLLALELLPAQVRRMM